MTTEGKKFSQIADGGAINPATDQIMVVRNGTTDNLVDPGTAVAKNASDATKAVVASISGTINAGHMAVFADTSGTLQDGGIPNAAAGRTIIDPGSVTLIADDQKILLAKTSPETTNVNFDPTVLTPWKTYMVQDGLGNAFNFPFTIVAIKGAINGQASISVGVSWGSIEFFTDGTNTFAKY